MPRPREGSPQQFMTCPTQQVHFEETIERPDQWTLGQSRQMPLHKFNIDDPLGTEVYVSARLGEVTMMTTRRSRTLAWLGTIPHWFYFAALRDNQPLWYQIVVWTSGLGCVLALLGLILGVTQYRWSRPRTSINGGDRHPLFRLDALALHHRCDFRRVHAHLGIQRHAVDGAVRLGDQPRASDPARRVHRRRRGPFAFPADGSREVGTADGRAARSRKWSSSGSRTIRTTSFAPPASRRSAASFERLHQPYNVTGRRQGHRLFVARRLARDSAGSVQRRLDCRAA